MTCRTTNAPKELLPRGEIVRLMLRFGMVTGRLGKRGHKSRKPIALLGVMSSPLALYALSQGGTDFGNPEFQAYLVRTCL